VILGQGSRPSSSRTIRVITDSHDRDRDQTITMASIVVQRDHADHAGPMSSRNPATRAPRRSPRIDLSTVSSDELDFEMIDKDATTSIRSPTRQPDHLQAYPQNTVRSLWTFVTLGCFGRNVILSVHVGLLSLLPVSTSQPCMN